MKGDGAAEAGAGMGRRRLTLGMLAEAPVPPGAAAARGVLVGLLEGERTVAGARALAETYGAFAEEEAEGICEAARGDARLAWALLGKPGAARRYARLGCCCRRAEAERGPVWGEGADLRDDLVVLLRSWEGAFSALSEAERGPFDRLTEEGEPSPWAGRLAEAILGWNLAPLAQAELPGEWMWLAERIRWLYEVEPQPLFGPPMMAWGLSFCPCLPDEPPKNATIIYVEGKGGAPRDCGGPGILLRPWPVYTSLTKGIQAAISALKPSAPPSLSPVHVILSGTFFPEKRIQITLPVTTRKLVIQSASSLCPAVIDGRRADNTSRDAKSPTYQGYDHGLIEVMRVTTKGKGATAPLVIRNLVVRNSKGHGILVRSTYDDVTAGRPIEGVTIQDVRVEACWRAGVQLEGVKNFKLERVTAARNLAFGISIFPALEDRSKDPKSVPAADPARSGKPGGKGTRWNGEIRDCEAHRNGTWDFRVPPGTPGDWITNAGAAGVGKPVREWPPVCASSACKKKKADRTKGEKVTCTPCDRGGVDRMGWGIAINNAARVLVVGCEAHDNRAHGFDASRVSKVPASPGGPPALPAEQVSFVRCFGYRNGNAGFSANSGADKITYRRCIAWRNGQNWERSTTGGKGSDKYSGFIAYDRAGSIAYYNNVSLENSQHGFHLKSFRAGAEVSFLLNIAARHGCSKRSPCGWTPFGKSRDYPWGLSLLVGGGHGIIRRFAGWPAATHVRGPLNLLEGNRTGGVVSYGSPTGPVYVLIKVSGDSPPSWTRELGYGWLRRGSVDDAPRAERPVIRALLEDLAYPSTPAGRNCYARFAAAVPFSIRFAALWRLFYADEAGIALRGVLTTGVDASCSSKSYGLDVLDPSTLTDPCHPKFAGHWDVGALEGGRWRAMPADPGC